MNLPSMPANLKVAKGLDVSRITTFGAPMGAIFVSVVILLFVVWPKLTEALKLRASNAELSSRVEALSTKAQLLSSLDKVQLDSEIGLAEQILPSDKAVFSFVRQIESAAARNGVLLSKVDVAPGSLSGGNETTTPAAGAISDPAPKIQVKVATTSDYKSFIKFLTEMYSVSRVIGIRDLTLSSGSAAGAEGTALRSSLVIDAYWKSLPTQLGSVESLVENLSTREEEVLKRVRALEVSGTVPPAVVPSVPTGRSDLFAPF